MMMSYQDLGQIRQSIYRLVQVVQEVDSVSGAVLDTIPYAEWPDRLEAQLLEAQREVTALRAQLAQMGGPLHAATALKLKLALPSELAATPPHCDRIGSSRTPLLVCDL